MINFVIGQYSSSVDKKDKGTDIKQKEMISLKEIFGYSKKFLISQPVDKKKGLFSFPNWESLFIVEMAIFLIC